MPGACSPAVLSAARVAAAAFVLLLAGCATRVDVRFDPAQDFSRYRTWDWDSRASHVYGDTPDTARQLDAMGARLVDQTLYARGLRRGGRGADLLIGYALEVRRMVVVVNETAAEGTLSSLHMSPSYAVQATEQRIEVHHEGRLRIVATDRRDARVVWEGDLRTRSRGEFAPHLREAISRLLTRFPRVQGQSGTG